MERSEQDPNLGFVPSNRVFASHITQSENTVSHDHSSFTGSSNLDAIKNHNSLILSRQGPYGWPTWKQLRGSEHPVSKHLRSNSLVSIVFDEDDDLSFMHENNRQIVINSNEFFFIIFFLKWY